MSTTVRLTVLHGMALLQGVLRPVAAYLPDGRPIPGEVWDRRHAVIVKLVWLHAAGLLGASILIGELHLEGIVGSVVIALLAAAGHRPWGSRRLRACLTSVGLLASSAVMVHLSGGVGRVPRSVGVRPRAGLPLREGRPA